MFVVTVEFSIHPQHATEFMREMVANARASREREPGCKVFDVCQDPAQPCEIFLYEIYLDKAAFDQHLTSAHYLAFNQTVTPWVSSKRVKILALVDR